MLSEFYCRTCYHGDVCCQCSEESRDWVDAAYCTDCGTICEEDDLDRNECCEECGEYRENEES